MKKVLSVLALGAMLFSCGNEAQTTSNDALILKLNLKEGEVYTQNFKISIDLDQELMGQEVESFITMNMVYSNKVVDFKNGEYTIASKFEEINMEMKNDMMNFSMSSEKIDESNPMNAMMSRAMRGMKKSTLTMIMDEYGKIKEITGFDKMMENAFADNPDLSPEIQAQIKAQLAQSINEEALKTQMSYTSQFYKKEEMKVGDTWNVETPKTDLVPFNMNTEYTLKEITDETVIVTGKSKMENVESVVTEGLEMTAEGVMDIELTINRSTGWVKTALITQDITTLTITNVNGEKMEMPMHMVSKIEITE